MVSSVASEKVRLRFIPPASYHPKLARTCYDDYEVRGINSLGQIVSKFTFQIRRTKHGCLLIAEGTESVIKRQGLGTRMWDLALKKIKPTVIEVVTVSLAGEKLINSLKRKYPMIEWEHHEGRTRRV